MAISLRALATHMPRSNDRRASTSVEMRPGTLEDLDADIDRQLIAGVDQLGFLPPRTTGVIQRFDDQRFILRQRGGFQGSAKGWWWRHGVLNWRMDSISPLSATTVVSCLSVQLIH